MHRRRKAYQAVFWTSLLPYAEQFDAMQWETVDGGQTPEDEIAVLRRMHPDTILLVDAAQMGLEPGSVRMVDEDRVACDFLITTHSLPIAFLLSELRSCSKNLVFLGIQIARTGFMEPLHPAVLEAVRGIYDKLASVPTRTIADCWSRM